MDKVNKLVEAGASVSTAIKEALLPMTVGEFSDKYDLPRPAVSNAINSRIRPTDELVNALVSEMGGEAHEWRMLLWKAAEPVADAAASAAA